VSVAVVLSGYLAGVTLRGAADEDGIETQSRVEVSLGRVAAHTALTIDALARDAPALDTFRDVEAGAAIDLVLGVPMRVLAGAHALDTGSSHGGAAYVGLAARDGDWDVELGAGGVRRADLAGDELIVRVGRRRLGRIDLTAIALATQSDRARISAGGEAVVHTGPLAWKLEGLAGARTGALLAHGQWLESSSGVQHGWLRATAAIDLGTRGTLFAAASIRSDTTDTGRDLVVAAVIAGASSPL
jgi:hypothetical protein